MKKFLLATVALAALGAAAPAFGADLGARPYYNKAPAYAAPLYNWTGFYIGGHLGGAFSGSNAFNGLVAQRLQRPPARRRAGRRRLAVRAELGCRRRSPVLLARPQQSRRNLPRRARLSPTTSAGSASITGRVGYTWGPGLVYVKGGYAYSDNSDTLTLGGVPVAFALDGNHRDGYTVGAGVEYMFTQNWSAKAEYQYYNFGSTRFVTPAALVPFGSFRNDDHTLKARRQLSLQFRRPGGRTLLTGSCWNLEEAGCHAGLFHFTPVRANAPPARASWFDSGPRKNRRQIEKLRLKIAPIRAVFPILLTR